MTPRRRIPFHLTYPLQRTVRAAPALCPGRVLLLWVPLGQSPSLRLLRRRHEAGFVRRLLRYYGTVRLPMPVHHRRTSYTSPTRPAISRRRYHGTSRFSNKMSLRACTGSMTSRDRMHLALTMHPLLPSASSHGVGFSKKGSFAALYLAC